MYFKSVNLIFIYFERKFHDIYNLTFFVVTKYSAIRIKSLKAARLFENDLFETCLKNLTDLDVLWIKHLDSFISFSHRNLN